MMPRVGDQTRSALQRRLCRRCGYDGPILGGTRLTYCPRCRCDFSVRPPRSYAEMEGLVEPDASPPDLSDPPPVRPARRRFERWMAWGLGSLIGSIAVYRIALLLAHAAS